MNVMMATLSQETDVMLSVSGRTQVCSLAPLPLPSLSPARRFVETASTLATTLVMMATM